MKKTLWTLIILSLIFFSLIHAQQNSNETTKDSILNKSINLQGLSEGVDAYLTPQGDVILKKAEQNNSQKNN